jgi:hypothetical protein
MATIVNTPAPSGDSGNNMAAIAGLILFIVVIFILLVYGIPALRRVGVGSAPQINVPKDINVNVNQQPSQ